LIASISKLEDKTNSEREGEREVVFDTKNLSDNDKEATTGKKRIRANITDL